MITNFEREALAVLSGEEARENVSRLIFPLIEPRWTCARFFEAIDEQESPQSVLPKIKAKHQEALQLSKKWGEDFEKALRN